MGILFDEINEILLSNGFVGNNVKGFLIYFITGKTWRGKLSKVIDNFEFEKTVNRKTFQKLRFYIKPEHRFIIGKKIVIILNIIEKLKQITKGSPESVYLDELEKKKHYNIKNFNSLLSKALSIDPRRESRKTAKDFDKVIKARTVMKQDTDTVLEKIKDVVETYGVKSKLLLDFVKELGIKKVSGGGAIDDKKLVAYLKDGITYTDDEVTAIKDITPIDLKKMKDKERPRNLDPLEERIDPRAAIASVAVQPSAQAVPSPAPAPPSPVPPPPQSLPPPSAPNITDDTATSNLSNFGDNMDIFILDDNKKRCEDFYNFAYYNFVNKTDKNYFIYKLISHYKLVNSETDFSKKFKNSVIDLYKTLSDSNLIHNNKMRPDDKYVDAYKIIYNLIILCCIKGCLYYNSIEETPNKSLQRAFINYIRDNHPNYHSNINTLLDTIFKVPINFIKPAIRYIIDLDKVFTDINESDASNVSNVSNVSNAKKIFKLICEDENITENNEIYEDISNSIIKESLLSKTLFSGKFYPYSLKLLKEYVLKEVIDSGGIKFIPKSLIIKTMLVLYFTFIKYEPNLKSYEIYLDLQDINYNSFLNYILNFDNTRRTTSVVKKDVVVTIDTYIDIKQLEEFVLKMKKNRLYVGSPMLLMKRNDVIENNNETVNNYINDPKNTIAELNKPPVFTYNLGDYNANYNSFDDADRAKKYIINKIFNFNEAIKYLIQDVYNYKVYIYNELFTHVKQTYSDYNSKIKSNLDLIRKTNCKFNAKILFLYYYALDFNNLANNNSEIVTTVTIQEVNLATSQNTDDTITIQNINNKINNKIRTKLKALLKTYIEFFIKTTRYFDRDVYINNPFKDHLKEIGSTLNDSIGPSFGNPFTKEVPSPYIKFENELQEKIKDFLDKACRYYVKTVSDELHEQHTINIIKYNKEQGVNAVIRYLSYILTNL